MQTLSPDITAATGSIWVTVASSLVSGIIGVLVTIIYSHVYEKRRMKFDVLRRFVANRYDTRGIEWTKAANEILIIFQDSREVMQILAGWHRFADRNNWPDYVLKLFKAMCRDVKVKIEFNDSFFLNPFSTTPP